MFNRKIIDQMLDRIRRLEKKVYELQGQNIFIWKDRYGDTRIDGTSRFADFDLVPNYIAKITAAELFEKIINVCELDISFDYGHECKINIDKKDSMKESVSDDE